MRRRRAEWLMTDTCVIDRPTGSYNWNPQTGHDEPTTERTYEGKCRLRQQTMYGSDQTNGGHTYTVQQTEVHIPWGSSYSPKINDVITVTGWRYPFRVRGLINQTHATARRMLVDAVTA
ncbi:DUF6093 family protein [Actinomyces gerencseriae]|uniref:DUF6093 family protein n=1 Tax=Actinomyces gerencseriae TaxID=52769 RepID=UPI0023F115A2|nr:DUF6093 family protein [Actinomyces gerencseriae]